MTINQVSSEVCEFSYESVCFRQLDGDFLRTAIETLLGWGSVPSHTILFAFGTDRERGGQRVRHVLLKVFSC